MNMTLDYKYDTKEYYELHLNVVKTNMSQQTPEERKEYDYYNNMLLDSLTEKLSSFN